MKIAVYTQQGEKKGDMTLPAEYFGVEVNEGLIHQALVRQHANARRPIAHTKTRGEVRGGGRKPHRQKGTGRARTGSIRGGLHVGGGIIFGPRNTRNFSKNMPKKMRMKALTCALSAKAKDEAVMALESFEGKEIKTKNVAEMVKKFPESRNYLFVLPEKNEFLEKSARNLPNVKTILLPYLNIADILKYRKIVFLKKSIELLPEVFKMPTAKDQVSKETKEQENKAKEEVPA